MALNMIDGFDVLVMAFTASAVSGHWKLSGSELGFCSVPACSAWLQAPCCWRRWPTSWGVALDPGLPGGGGPGHAGFGLEPDTDPTGRFTCDHRSGCGWHSGLQQCDCERICVVALAQSGRHAAIDGLCIGCHHRRQYRRLAAGPSRLAFRFHVRGAASLAVLVLAWFALPESLDFLVVKRPANAAAAQCGGAQTGVPALTSLPSFAAADTSQNQRPGPLQLLAPELRRPTILVWLSFFAVMFGFTS